MRAGVELWPTAQKDVRSNVVMTAKTKKKPDGKFKKGKDPKRFSGSHKGRPAAGNNYIKPGSARDLEVSERRRRVVEMHVDGEPFAKIAEKLDIAISTAEDDWWAAIKSSRVDPDERKEILRQR